MSLKKNKGSYIEGFREREMMQLYCNFKNKTNNKSNKKAIKDCIVY